MDSELLTASHYFAINSATAHFLFDETEHVWDGLGRIEACIEQLLPKQTGIGSNPRPGVVVASRRVFIHPSAIIEPGAYISGPAYIDAKCVVRHGAYLRENVLMLEGSLVGHASEVKNSVLLEGAKAPHFAYVGDSILGANVNLGAGTILSNLSIASAKDSSTGKRSTLNIRTPSSIIDSGLSKFGAIIGDNGQTGCNVVTNPGCLLGQEVLVYPGTVVPSGYHAPWQIIKLRQRLEIAQRRP